MSRVEPQLREYFDAGVERISVEDVIAQAEVRQNHLEPLQGRRTLRPAWAAVGAFAVTILGLGGLAAALKLTERITGEFDASAAEIVAADGGTLGIWLIAAFVAALAAAGVTWLVRRPTEKDAKNTKDEENQGKVMVMETIEESGTETGTTKQTTKPSRLPTVLIVVLAVALVGLLAWMVFMMRPNSPNAAPPEIVQLMEDYHAAWSAYDADALDALVTDSYRLYGPNDSFSDYDPLLFFDNDIEDIRGSLMPLIETQDWQVTAPGPLYAVNTSGYRWAVSGEGSTITRNGIDYEANDLWTVVAPNGEYLVSEHYMVGG
jgi:flagellar basal body-associated protein FliL